MTDTSAAAIATALPPTTTVSFDAGFQNKIVTMSLRDQVFAQRIEGMLEPKFFDNEANSYLVDFSNKHYEKYKQPPSVQILIAELKAAKAAKRLKDPFIEAVSERLKQVYAPGADLSNREWTVDQVSSFVRQRAMEAAIEKAIDVLDKGGEFAEIDEAIKKAQSVGAHEGTGAVSYIDNLRERLLVRAAKLAGTSAPLGITTGHKEIDDLLYHKGWGRKEMAILMGGAKSGKSTALQHFAIKAVEAGYNALYVTLENSKEVTQDRMDAAVSGIPMRDLDTAAAAVEAAVMKMASKGGRLEIHEFPGGACKPSDIRRLIQKYAAQGVKFDILVVDYADEMAAERKHNEERHAFKEIYQGLRAIGIDENLAVLTATQTNRAGNKAATAKTTDVSEDFNKVRLADVLITINSTEEEKKTGQLRLFLAAMRNSEDGITVTCMCDRARQRFITKIIKID